MKKMIQLLPIILLIIGCKSTVKTPIPIEKPKPISAYEQQKENIEKGIYFRANGSEKDWSLKISEKNIEFVSLLPYFGTFTVNSDEPDINPLNNYSKGYTVYFDNNEITIEIMKRECFNQMSGDKSPYYVTVVIVKNHHYIYLEGCGNYITDPRLHDIWVLEQLNGQKVTPADFTKELPNLEINSSTNQFTGFAGCNRMNGTIFFERGVLRFANSIGITRMFCGEKNKEPEFLKALQSTTTYKVENLRLTLTNPAGGELVFKKVD